jgi:hypothetical protein
MSTKMKGAIVLGVVFSLGYWVRSLKDCGCS